MADGALIRSLATAVCTQQVSPSVSSLGEPLTTHGTLERLFASVGTEVTLEEVSPPEPALALGTPIRPLTGMAPDVSPERLLSSK